MAGECVSDMSFMVCSQFKVDCLLLVCFLILECQNIDDALLSNWPCELFFVFHYYCLCGIARSHIAFQHSRTDNWVLQCGAAQHQTDTDRTGINCSLRLINCAALSFKIQSDTILTPVQQWAYREQQTTERETSKKMKERKKHVQLISVACLPLRVEIWFSNTVEICYL